jgi:hypothetical protein
VGEEGAGREEALFEVEQEGRVDATGLGMGAGSLGGGPADAEGFEVVVPGEVSPEAHHGVGDVAGEARGFAVVVGEGLF